MDYGVDPNGRGWVDNEKLEDLWNFWVLMGAPVFVTLSLIAGAWYLILARPDIAFAAAALLSGPK